MKFYHRMLPQREVCGGGGGGMDNREEVGTQ